jgi:hypothetical protein
LQLALTIITFILPTLNNLFGGIGNRLTPTSTMITLMTHPIFTQALVAYRANNIYPVLANNQIVWMRCDTKQPHEQQKKLSNIAHTFAGLFVHFQRTRLPLN